jgi:FlaA1/EpsC-like NDP-sugar epimerase
MLREKEAFLTRLMKITDALVIAVAFVLAYFITLGLKRSLDLGPLAFATTVSFSGVVFFLRNHIMLVLITIPTWISLMSVDGVYANFRTKLFIEILWRVLRTGVGSLLVLGSGVFLFKMILTSRMYVAVFAAAALFGLFIEKACWRWFLDYVFKQGYNLVNILIVGTGKRAQEFIQLVQAHSNWGLNIIGLVDDDPKLLGKKVLD